MEGPARRLPSNVYRLPAPGQFVDTIRMPVRRSAGRTAEPSRRTGQASKRFQIGTRSGRFRRIEFMAPGGVPSGRTASRASHRRARPPEASRSRKAASAPAAAAAQTHTRTPRQAGAQNQTAAVTRRAAASAATEQRSRSRRNASIRRRRTGVLWNRVLSFQ